MFCPGNGIAVDSCARVIALLDRPAAGSIFVSAGAVITVSAAGSDASDAAPAVIGGGDDGSGAVAALGSGLRVSGAGLPQAAKPAATRHKVLAVINMRIKILQKQ